MTQRNAGNKKATEHANNTPKRCFFSMHQKYTFIQIYNTN